MKWPNIRYRASVSAGDLLLTIIVLALLFFIGVLPWL